MTNSRHTVLYVGVTSNLIGRVKQHRSGFYKGSFTARYRVNKLVYYNLYDSIEVAIAEEKRLKGGSRKQKIKLIESMNPQWDDLFIKEVAKWI